MRCDSVRCSDQLYRKYGSTYQGIIEEKLLGEVQQPKMLETYNEEVFEEVNLLGLLHPSSDNNITGYFSSPRGFISTEIHLSV
jgi:hypothetical protein